jgi:hypothetical protein
MERLKRGYGRLERLEGEVEGWKTCREKLEGWKDWRGGRWMIGRLEGRLEEWIH